MKRLLYMLIVAAIALIACSGPTVPGHFNEVKALPPIYPDYADVTVPVNIAPLCFELLNGADEAVTRFTAGSREMLCDGLKVRPDAEEWHALASAARDGSISVEVYTRSGDRWTRFKPFSIYVSADSIDPWMSYRMISPSYVSYEELTINQRCLENFDERVIADNMLCSSESGGQCINCHSYQQHDPQRLQLHARQTHGGTFILSDGYMEKVDIKATTAYSKSSHDTSPAVYPAWHPRLPLIAYSTNSTMQTFHTVHTNKIEVIDGESGLILYDVDHHKVTPIEDRRDELETYPCWSADGRWLYYVSAHFSYRADSVDTEDIILRAKEVRYNLYRKAFDQQTRRFGERQLVLAADSMGLSATLPRVSPDGRWLMFTMAAYGCFHIWHHDADLWLMDLHDGSIRPLEAANSDDTESYHSWSSNGRWVVFSSRRNDGNFTRPFFVHIDKNGQAAKPFELPQADPDLHRQLLKSYNAPELMRGPVTVTPQQVAATMKGDGVSTR